MKKYTIPAVIVVVVLVLLFVLYRFFLKTSDSNNEEEKIKDCTDMDTIYLKMNDAINSIRNTNPTLDRVKILEEATKQVADQNDCIFKEKYPMYCSFVTRDNSFDVYISDRFNDLDYQSKSSNSPYYNWSEGQIYLEAIKQVSNDWSCQTQGDPLRCTYARYVSPTAINFKAYPILSNVDKTNCRTALIQP